MKKILFIAAVLLCSVAQAQIKPAVKGVVYGSKTTAEGAIEVNMLEEKLL